MLLTHPTDSRLTNISVLDREAYLTSAAWNSCPEELVAIVNTVATLILRPSLGSSKTLHLIFYKSNYVIILRFRQITRMSITSNLLSFFLTVVAKRTVLDA